jgi:ABC-type nitrate/sulfonate/bicarbonate transport system permease component
MTGTAYKIGRRLTPISLVIRTLGVALIPLLWLFLKHVVHVTDRYLPSVLSVFGSINDISPSIFVHLAYTVSRFAVGFLLGVGLGLALGLWLFKFSWLFDLLMPTIQATRAIPAIAIIPFFILWFGFSEFGRYLLIITGTSLNIGVATYQIVRAMPEKDLIMFKSFHVRPEKMIMRYGLPRVAEGILPTLRFSLSTAIGLIVASELLGSQVGLGYLIQTSQSTFSMHVVFLVTILLGIVNVTADWCLKSCWSRLVFWRNV